MAMRFSPPEQKNEAQELLRQGSRDRPRRRVGQRQTSRVGGAGGGGAEARRVRQVKVYTLKDGKAEPVDVQVGITDGSQDRD